MCLNKLINKILIRFKHQKIVMRKKEYTNLTKAKKLKKLKVIIINFFNKKSKKKNLNQNKIINKIKYKMISLIHQRTLQNNFNLRNKKLEKVWRMRNKTPLIIRSKLVTKNKMTMTMLLI